MAVEGLCECEIRLYGASDEQVTSPRFTMRVSSTVYDDGQTESQSEWSIVAKRMKHNHCSMFPNKGAVPGKRNPQRQNPVCDIRKRRVFVATYRVQALRDRDLADSTVNREKLKG